MIGSFETIGVIRSCYQQKFAMPRQSGLVSESWAELEVFAKFQPELSLAGLESFSHIWILFLFHDNNNKDFRAKIKPPRLEGESMGVFATRSPHRPNSIGLSLVELEKISMSNSMSKLTLRGGDFLDQTPVLDIKPYIAETESRYSTEGWTKALRKNDFEVVWSSQALNQLLQTHLSS